MKLSRIQLETVYAQIGVRTTPAKLTVKSPSMSQLSIRSTAARMTINRTRGQLNIDQTEAFATSGLQTPMALSASWANSSRSHATNYIGKASSDGTYLGNIHQGSSVGQLARNNSVRNISVNVGAMPKARPKVSYTPSQMDISWDPHKVEISYEFRGVEYEYIPAAVEFYMLQYGEVKVKVEQKEYYNDAIDKMIEKMNTAGRNVDEVY